MKHTICKIVSVLMVVTMLFSTGIAAITSSAASESSYKATFSIVTDKKTVAKGENVTVSLKLKTNYYIFAMEVPVMYDAEAFEVQNTSATNNKSFLTFKGKLADAYTTNGNWKSPDTFYTKANSNSEYWTSVKNKYKIAFASWAADSSKNNGKAIKLDTEETIVSFVLKAKKDISDTTNGLIFISKDFQKTSTFAGGKFFCGRSVNEKINVQANGYVTVGQTLEFTGKVPAQQGGQTGGNNDKPVTEDGAVSINYKATLNLSEYVETNKTLKWESADESVVTVDEDGNIYGAKTGTATVTAKSTDGKFTKTFTVTVSYSVLQWIIIILLFGWIWY